MRNRNYLRRLDLHRNLHHRQTTENLKKEKRTKTNKEDLIWWKLFGLASLTASFHPLSLALIRRLCSSGDVNCADHQIKDSSGSLDPAKEGGEQSRDL